MAKVELSLTWWENNKPEGFKGKDLDRALAWLGNQQRAMEKSQEPGLAKKLADAADGVEKAVAATVKALDKKEDADLIGELAALAKLAGKEVRQADAMANETSADDFQKALAGKVELSSDWWAGARAGLGLKDKTLERALGALENAHRGFERGAEGDWVKQIGDLQKLIKAGAAASLKEARKDVRKDLARALTELLALAAKDAQERGAG